MRILKFGGTSVGSIDNLRTVANVIVDAAGSEPIVTVVSAFSNVTNQLTDAIDAASQGKPVDNNWLDELKRRHHETVVALADGDADVTRDIDAQVNALAAQLADAQKHYSPAVRDQVLAFGERLATPVVAAILRQRGLHSTAMDATRLISTDSTFGAAEVNSKKTRELCQAELAQLDAALVPVVTGFIGADDNGNVTTLSRGGSDYSASVLGAALDARRVEIWTDVDGVMSADPNIVPEARHLSHLSYRAASALADAGADVLHPKTVFPLVNARIPIEVYSIRQPGEPPTLITAEGSPEPVRAVSGHLISEEQGSVTIVSDNARYEANLATRALSMLNRTGITVTAFENNRAERTLTARLSADDLTRAIKILHRVIVPQPAQVALAIAGATGRVGSELLRQLRSQAEKLEPEVGAEIILVGVINSRQMAWYPDGDGIRWDNVKHTLDHGEKANWSQFAEHLLRHDGRLVFIDCTSDNAIARDYTALLNGHVAVATPNKQASTQVTSDFKNLMLASRDGAPYRYSTAVGAGLPILRAIRRMRQSGDEIRKIRAVLSGTVGYVFDRLNHGDAFSVAVAAAHKAGYTEPHPRDDLDGADVTRKILIMLREAGLELDMDDIETESLVPVALSNEDDPVAFLSRLKAHDNAWKKRVEQAHKQGCKLTYGAYFDGKTVNVGVISAPADDALALLQGTENLAIITTGYYRDLPVKILGPGAGVEVTAACLLADVVDAARTLGRLFSEPVLTPSEKYQQPLRAIAN